jgi:hypothetical protein
VQTGTSSQLNIPVPTADNTGNYTCEISGACGTVLSKNIILTVYPLTAITHFTPVTEVVFGNSATLDVTSDGHDLTYQWMKDGVILGNSNASRLVLNNVNASDIGIYQTIVTGTCGTVTSDTLYAYVKTPGYSSEPEVFVWPTISSSEYNVALSNDSDYNIRLFSTAGKLIRDIPNCKYQTIVNVSNLASAMYVLEVFNNNFRKSIKVIKE